MHIGIFREDELGTIAEGKLADIVVLDRNLFRVPVTEIKETPAIFTMVDGNIVYQDRKQVVQNY
ncbi:amidohydrolase family protein [Bacillus sp. C1]